MSVFLQMISEAEAEAATMKFSVTMIVTFALSLLLLIVLIALILPHKKKSPAFYALKSLKKALAASEDFIKKPCADTLKKLRKAARSCDRSITAAIYKGLVELNPAREANDETVKICGCLKTSKADEKTMAEFAEIVYRNTLHATGIAETLAGREKEEGPFALSGAKGAKSYLDSVRKNRIGGVAEEVRNDAADETEEKTEE